MPVLRHDFTAAGILHARINETMLLPGEISTEDYQASFSVHGVLKGHTPSVILVTPEHADHKNSHHRHYPTDLPMDFWSNWEAQADYLHSMHEKISAHFNSLPQDSVGPYHINFCHNGISVFFARTHDKKAFLKAMHGAFADIHGADEENLNVAKARIAQNYKPKSESLQADYEYVAGDRSVYKKAKPARTGKPGMELTPEQEDALYAEALQGVAGYLAAVARAKGTPTGDSAEAFGNVHYPVAKEPKKELPIFSGLPLTVPPV